MNRVRFENSHVRTAFVTATSSSPLHHCHLDLVGLDVSDHDVACLVKMYQQLRIKSMTVDTSGARISHDGLDTLLSWGENDKKNQTKTQCLSGETFFVEVDALHIAQHNGRIGIQRAEVSEWAPTRNLVTSMYESAIRLDRQTIYAQHVLCGVHDLLLEVRVVRNAVVVDVAAMFTLHCLYDEHAWRGDIILEEETAKKGLQRTCFRSFDLHKGAESTRLMYEQSQREKIGLSETAGREEWGGLQARCWKVYITCAKEETQRMDHANEMVLRHVEDDRKRHASRLSDLDAKRDLRRDRVVKDEQKTALREQVEREQVMRSEIKMRAKIEDGDEAVLREMLLQVNYFHHGQSLKIANVGLALRARDKLMKMEVSVSVPPKSVPLKSFFPLAGGHKFDVAPGLEVVGFMPEHWGRQMEAATQHVRTTLHEHVALRSFDAPKEKELIKNIESHSKSALVFMDYKSSLYPVNSPAARATLATAQACPSRTGEECLRRKLTLWGGTIKVSHKCDIIVSPTMELFSDFLSFSHSSEKGGEVTMEIPPDGTVTLAMVTHILQSVTLTIPSVSKPEDLPLISSVELSLCLRFANLVDSLGDEMPFPSGVYFVKKNVSIPFLLCQPFVLQYFSGVSSWEEGCTDLCTFSTVSVSVAPKVLSNPTLRTELRKSDRGAFDGGTLVIKFTRGYTPDDRILFASVNQLGTSITNNGIVKVGDEVLGQLKDGVLPRLKDVTTITPKPCDRITISLTGPGATPSNVETFVRCLRYWNTSKDPALGVRHLAVEVSDSTNASCFCITKVEVMPKDNPTTMVVPTTRLVSHSVCTGSDVPESMIHYIELHELPIAADAIVADIDTDHFVGGHLTVRINPLGLLRGDDVCLIPSMAGNEAIMEGETPEPVGIYIEGGNRLSYYGICFGTVTWTVNESKDPVVFKKAEKKAKKKAGPTVDDPGVGPTSPTMDDALIVSNFISFTEVLPIKEEATVMVYPDYDANIPVVNSQIHIEFDTDGSARICAVHELLRCIHYRSKSYIPKPGERTIEITLDVGPTFQKQTVDGYYLTEGIPHHNETMRASVTLKVSHPIFKVATKAALVRYPEGSGAKRFIPVEIASSDDACVEHYNQGTLRVEIVEGGNDEDELWVRDEGGIEIVLHSNNNPKEEEAAPSMQQNKPREQPNMLCPTPPNTPCDSPPSSPGRGLGKEEVAFMAKLKVRMQEFADEKSRRRMRMSAALKNLIGETQRIFASRTRVKTCDITWQKTVVGSVTTTGHGCLEIQFCRKDSFVLTRKEVTAIIRAVTYKNTSQNPQSLEKKVRITLRDASSTYTQGMLMVVIQRFDDPTEFVLTSDRVRYRQGANEVETTIGAFAIVPLDQGYIVDPDTAFFDGGYFSVESVAGGSRGDTVGLLTAAQQHMTFQKRSRHPSYILTLDDATNQLKGGDGVIVADVTFPRNAYMMTSDILLKFRDHRPKKISLELVSFILNIITFSCTTNDRVKEGTRQYRFTISDGVNPLLGKQTLHIDVQSALVYIPNFTTSMVYALGDEPLHILSRAVCNTDKSATLTTGFIDIRISRGDCFDALCFMPPWGGGMSIIGSCLVDSGVFLGRVTMCTNMQISISLSLMSKLSSKTLEVFLRNVVYSRPSTPEAIAVPVITRTITVTINDGSFYPNILNVTIVLQPPKPPVLASLPPTSPQGKPV